MIYTNLFLILVIFVTASWSQKFFGNPKSYCLANDSNPYLLFGSKTIYEHVRGPAGSETNCKAVQFWSLNRHGTRRIKDDEIEELKLAVDLQTKILNFYAAQNLPADHLCSEDIAALKLWRWNTTSENLGETLTDEGAKELILLAKRYQSRYPSLLGGDYSPNDFYFRHTFAKTTEGSCKVYIEGLFGKENSNNVVIETPNERDEVIRPYETCAAWKEDVDLSPDRKEQTKAFRKSSDYLKLLDNISKRLGFKKTLKHDDIDIMYDICRYEKSWSPEKTSPWCSVFNKVELLLMEYHNDIKTYYKISYGHEYNAKLGCKPLQHLMETFEKTVKGNEAQPKALHLFTHHTMIGMVLAALEFSKDTMPLMGTDYDDHLVNRLFRSSMHLPFAGNLVAVLHQCSDKEEDYQVQFFLNESPMNIKGCTRGLCTWSSLKKLLSSVLPCNLDFCTKN